MERRKHTYTRSLWAGILLVVAIPFTASAQLPTNLITSSWFDRLVEVVEGTRERAKALQYEAWATFGEADPPIIIHTNFGVWNTNGAVPGFVSFKPAVTTILTNTIFELGKRHPALDGHPKFQPTLWDSTLLGVYRVVPPYNAITTYEDEGRYIISISNSSFGVVTNVGLAITTNNGTAFQTNIFRRRLLQQVDVPLYRMMSWYGERLIHQSNYFRLFDQDSYGLNSKFDTNGLDVIASTAAAKFLEWGIGDGTNPIFTRQPKNAFRTVILAEIVFDVISKTRVDGADIYVADWTSPRRRGTNFILQPPAFIAAPPLIVDGVSPFSQFIQYLGSVMWRPDLEADLIHNEHGAAESYAINATVDASLNTNDTTIYPVVVGSIPTNATWELLDKDLTLRIEGTVLRRVADTNSIRDWELAPATQINTLLTTGGVTALTLPWSSVTTLGPINPTSITWTNPPPFTNLPIDHVGDTVHLQWDIPVTKLGDLAYQVYRSGIDQRFIVLTNMIFTPNLLDVIFHDTTNFPGGDADNQFQGDALSGISFAAAETLAIAGYAADDLDALLRQKIVASGLSDAGGFRSRFIHARSQAEVIGLHFQDVSRTVFFEAEADLVTTFLLSTPTSITHNVYEPNGSLWTNPGIWYTFDIISAPFITTNSSYQPDKTGGFGTIPLSITNTPDTSNTYNRGFEIPNEAAIAVKWNFENATE